MASRRHDARVDSSNGSLLRLSLPRQPRRKRVQRSPPAYRRKYPGPARVLRRVFEILIQLANPSRNRVRVYAESVHCRPDRAFVSALHTSVFACRPVLSCVCRNARQRQDDFYTRGLHEKRRASCNLGHSGDAFLPRPAYNSRQGPQYVRLPGGNGPLERYVIHAPNRNRITGLLLRVAVLALFPCAALAGPRTRAEGDKPAQWSVTAAGARGDGRRVQCNDARQRRSRSYLQRQYRPVDRGDEE